MSKVAPRVYAIFGNIDLEALLGYLRAIRRERHSQPFLRNMIVPASSELEPVIPTPKLNFRAAFAGYIVSVVCSWKTHAERGVFVGDVRIAVQIIDIGIPT